MEVSGRPLKLFVDAHVFDGEYQGSRTFIQEIYKLVLQHPEKYTVYFGASSFQAIQEAFPGFSAAQFVPYKSKNSFSRLLFELPTLLRKYGFDAAHFQYITPFIKPCKYIVTTHDVLFLDAPQYFSIGFALSRAVLFGLGLLRADLRTTVSDFSKGAIAKWYPFISKQSLHVVSNGVADEFFAPYEKTAVKQYVKERYGVERYVVLLSRIEPRKQHALVVRALLDGGWLDEGVHLLCVGHPSVSSPAFEAALKALTPKQRSQVRHLTQVEAADLVKLIQAAEVLVYPSLAEGFGLPPLEAGACKVPTICSNATAMGDFVFFGEGHIDPKDEQGFARVLNTFLSSPPAHDMLQSISDTIYKRYRWEHAAKTYMQLLDTLPPH